MNDIIKIIVYTAEQIGLWILPPVLLSMLMYKTVGTLQKKITRVLGLRAYMLLFGWSGTLIHEFSHLIVGVLFLHKIDSFHIHLFNPNTGKAGSVRLKHNPDSIFQKSGNFFIAIAPIFICTAVIYLFERLIIPEFLPIPSLETLTITAFMKVIYATFFNMGKQLIHFQNIDMWKGVLFVYILTCVGSGIRLSKTDMKQALPGGVILVGIFLTINPTTIVMNNKA